MAMSKQTIFTERMRGDDALMITVLGIPDRFVIQAVVKRIYGPLRNICGAEIGSSIQYIQSPNSWGNMILNLGETGIVFLSTIQGTFYQYHWHGQFLVEEIDGEMYGIYQQRELWLNDDLPLEIKKNSIQDPKRSYCSATRLSVLEPYLIELSEKFAASTKI
jgi:hypothetical protein